jgi:hypothetical protein
MTRDERVHVTRRENTGTWEASEIFIHRYGALMVYKEVAGPRRIQREAPLSETDSSRYARFKYDVSQSHVTLLEIKCRNWNNMLGPSQDTPNAILLLYI